MANNKRVKMPGFRFKGTATSVGLLPLVDHKRKGDLFYIPSMRQFWVYIGAKRWEEVEMPPMTREVNVKCVCRKCRSQASIKTDIRGVKLRKLDPKDKSRAEIVQRLEDKGYITDEIDIMLMDGHDNAFIDVVDRFGSSSYAVYSLRKVIANLIMDFRPSIIKELMGANPKFSPKELKEHADMDAEETAWDWYYYNMIGSWVGEGTPGFLNDI